MLTHKLSESPVEPNFKNGFMVHWQARLLLGPGDIRSGLIVSVRQGGFDIDFEHALSLGKEVGIEFFLNFEGAKQRIRLKAKVTYCKLKASNSGALLSLRTSIINRQDNHTLNNILHSLGDSDIV